MPINVMVERKGELLEVPDCLGTIIFALEVYKLQNGRKFLYSNYPDVKFVLGSDASMNIPGKNKKALVVDFKKGDAFRIWRT